MAPHTTLGKRGYELTKGPNLREQFSLILGNLYDPKTNPNGIVLFGVSENYAMVPELTLPTSAFSYGEGPWGTDRLRKSMAHYVNKNFGVHEPVDADKILFANGVTSICEMLGFTVADPGDGILLSKPIYQAFQFDFGTKARIKPVFVDFDGVDQFSPEAAAKYEEALLNAEKQGIKPHNPLGQCYPKETIIALMKLCFKYQVHLLSDEIYATSVYEVPDKNAVPFTSVLSFDSSPYISPDYCHMIYGLSKDFAGGGLRIGCIYLRNEELNRAMSAISQFHWSGGPSQEIATTILEDEDFLDRYQRLAKERLASRNKMARRYLDTAGIRYHQGANAGFFLWVDLRPFLPPLDPGMSSEWEREQALAKRMIDHKVFLTNGEGLSAEEPGFFRIIFSHDEETIRVGFKRLFEALGKKEAAASI
ncbi:MAG: hypothetical protein Q9162_002047 [Coniocarpon cinnabarinum]